MNYKLFDFQRFIRDIRSFFVKKGTSGEAALRILDFITDEMCLEDTVFYKEYLSRFDVEKAIEGYELVTDPTAPTTRDDYFILLRLCCASFSSNYEFLFDKNNKSVEFVINIGQDGRCAVKKLQDLFFFQVMVLMEEYLKEQVDLQAILQYSDSERDEVENERNFLAYYFNTKTKEWRRQAELEC